MSPSPIFLNAQEMALLAGFPHAGIVVYLVIRSRMDWQSGMVGNYPRISWRAIAEWCYVEPDTHGGGGARPVQLSISQVRRLVARLVKVGLLDCRNIFDPMTNREYLRFFCALASLKGHRSDKENREATQKIAQKSVQKMTEKTALKAQVDRGVDSPKPSASMGLSAAPDRGVDRGTNMGTNTGIEAVNQLAKTAPGKVINFPSITQHNHQITLGKTDLQLVQKTEVDRGVDSPKPSASIGLSVAPDRGVDRGGTVTDIKAILKRDFPLADNCVQIAPDRGVDSPKLSASKVSQQAPDRGVDIHSSKPIKVNLLLPSAKEFSSKATGNADKNHSVSSGVLNKNQNQTQTKQQNLSPTAIPDLPICPTDQSIINRNSMPTDRSTDEPLLNPTEVHTMQNIKPLIWPSCIHESQRHLLLARLSVSLQPQVLLDELAGAHMGGVIRSSPIAYLTGLLRREQEGQFMPTRAITVAAAREAQERYALASADQQKVYENDLERTGKQSISNIPKDSRLAKTMAKIDQIRRSQTLPTAISKVIPAL